MWPIPINSLKTSKTSLAVVHKLGWIMVACNQMVINKHYNYSPALTRGLFIIYHSLIIARARDRHNNHKNISNHWPAVFSSKDTERETK